jgi:hypothetical protein
MSNQIQRWSTQFPRHNNYLSFKFRTPHHLVPFLQMYECEMDKRLLRAWQKRLPRRGGYKTYWKFHLFEHDCKCESLDQRESLCYACVDHVVRHDTPNGYREEHKATF